MNYDVTYGNHVYVLKLEDDKYYCGMTSKIVSRIKKHFNGGGAVWTKKYPPIRIEECILIHNGDHPGEIEKQKTLEYMSLYGWENVRGSGWCMEKLLEKSISLTEIEPFRITNPIYWIRPKRKYRYDLSYRPRIYNESSHVFEEYFGKWMESLEYFKKEIRVDKNYHLDLNHQKWILNKNVQTSATLSNN